MFEEDRTRLTFNFDFRTVYAFSVAVAAIIIMILWVALSWELITSENAVVIGIMIGVLMCLPAAVVIGIDDYKEKFVDNIRKAFNLLNKTD